jgi:hypothetical protein
MREAIKQCTSALWTRAGRPKGTATPINVSYGTTIGEPIELFEGGRFHHADRIDIFRESYDGAFQFAPHWHRGSIELPDDVVLTEMLTLAHEYGHLLSYESGTWQGHEAALVRYQAALKAKQPAEAADYATVLAEERRAWVYAYEELASVGWSHWAVFEKEAQRALKTYEAVKHT